MNKRVLHLTLKKKWFDMIDSGEKRDEYREIKDYWCRRLLVCEDEMEYGVWQEMIEDMRNPCRHSDYPELLSYFMVSFREYDAVRFVNGYGEDRPSMMFRFKTTLGTGRTEWGAVEGVNYFLLHLGKRVAQYELPAEI